jgi:hypothetical protein
MIDRDALAQQPHLEGTVDEKRVVVLLGELTTVGRAPENTLPLSNQELSKQHFRVEKQGEKFVLTNLSSAGTMVGGLWVLSATLKDGDAITAGRLKLVVNLGALTGPRPMEVPLVAYEQGPLFPKARVRGTLMKDSAESDAQRFGRDLAQRFPTSVPSDDPRRAEYDGLVKAKKRLTDLEERCQEICERKKAREVLPNAAEHILGVLGADIAAVLGTQKELSRLAVAKREGLKGNPYVPAAVELAKEKSAPVTSARPTGERDAQGAELHHTLLAWSVPLGAEETLVFYAEAARRRHPYDAHDADSLRRLSLAAVTALEHFELLRRQ